MKTRFLLALAVLAITIPGFAQTASEDLTAIQDNSFMLEEAYNQEDQVIQHISVLTRDSDTGDWGYAFTQEIPVTSQKHQFSYTIPILHAQDTGLGDVMLNYRYQLTGTGKTQLAIAPRISLILPTGDDEKGFGSGSTGFEFNLPVSWVAAPRVVGHTNAGFRRNGGDDLVDLTLGHSFIYALNSRVHLMLEGVLTREEISRNRHETDVVINPGVRWAYNRASGLQIVPGVSFPIGEDSKGVLFYLSLEHPFGRR